MNSKKATDAILTLIIGVVILSVSLLVIWEVWDDFFSKAEESTAESLCMSFNALRTKSQVSEGHMVFNPVGLTCKTLDKVVPDEKIYPQTKEGAMEEMRSLVAKCWWMFLEGAQKNMFAKDLWIGQNPCFTCYRFSIKNDPKIGTISFTEFSKSLEETTYLAAVDSDLDNCAPVGGGICIDNDGEKKCYSRGTYKDFITPVGSNKCEKDQSCCIVKYDECVNKGGRCIPLNPGDSCKTKGGEFTQQYDKWSCNTGTCCIKDDNYYSYLDYVQHYRGDGAILYEPDMVFKPGEVYAITFVSPRPNFSWGFAAKAGGTSVITLAIGTIIAGVSLPVAVVVAAGTLIVGGVYTYTSGEQKLKDINVLFISKLDTVTNKCEIQPGTDGK